MMISSNLSLWLLFSSGIAALCFSLIYRLRDPATCESLSIVGIWGVQVIVEQLTSGPWNNFIFMTYLGMVVEGNVLLMPSLCLFIVLRCSMVCISWWGPSYFSI